jgi:hypothetical protein
MRRSHFAFGLVVALLVLGLSQAASARTLKQFRPGDVRACGVHRCVTIRSQHVLDALANFYYGRPSPARTRAPRKRSLYLRLAYRDGYVTGIAAGSRFTHFLSFGVNLGQFAARTWYAVPAAVAAELRLLAPHLLAGRLPTNIRALQQVALAPKAEATSSARCPVTVPQRASASGFNYGNSRLRAVIWPRGHLVAGILPGGGSFATINRDGSITAKLGWWRAIPGRLTIRGRRLDAPAPPLWASVPATQNYGPTGFIPTFVTFPTTGCWKVTGKQGSAHITFVVNVTKVKHHT